MNVNEAASTEDVRKSFEVKLDHEKNDHGLHGLNGLAGRQVIRIGAYFYDLKGVLICEDC